MCIISECATQSCCLQGSAHPAPCLLLEPKPCLGLSDADPQDAHEALLGSLASDQVMLGELDLLLKTTERLLQVGLLRLRTKSLS